MLIAADLAQRRAVQTLDDDQLRQLGGMLCR